MRWVLSGLVVAFLPVIFLVLAVVTKALLNYQGMTEEGKKAVAYVVLAESIGVGALLMGVIWGWH